MKNSWKFFEAFRYAGDDVLVYTHTQRECLFFILPKRRLPLLASQVDTLREEESRRRFCIVAL
jgi:hypothetical protein